MNTEMSVSIEEKADSRITTAQDMSPGTPIRVWGNAAFDEDQETGGLGAHWGNGSDGSDSGRDSERDSTTGDQLCDEAAAAHTAASPKPRRPAPLARVGDIKAGSACTAASDVFGPSSADSSACSLRGTSGIGCGAIVGGERVPTSPAVRSLPRTSPTPSSATRTSSTALSAALSAQLHLRASTGALEWWHSQLACLLAAGQATAACSLPAPSAGGLVRCRLSRTKSLLHGVAYSVRLDHKASTGSSGGGGGAAASGRPQQALLVARKCPGAPGIGSTYAIGPDARSLGVKASASSPLGVVRLRSNFMGTDYVLGGSARGSPDTVALHFTANALEGGPRSVTVALPLPDAGASVTDGGACSGRGGVSSSSSSAQGGQRSGGGGEARSDDLASVLTAARKRAGLPAGAERNVALLATRPPEYDDIAEAYTLAFPGRTVLPSIKNMQLACWDAASGTIGSKIVLQFAKVGRDEFALDFSFPLCMQSAAAVALALLDDKLCFTVG